MAKLETWIEFDDLVSETAQYPNAFERRAEGILYTTLGLTGEAGEVANQVKKILRDDAALLTPERRMKIVDELGDVFWYAFALCREINVLPESVLRHNINKLRARQAEGTIKGDKRDDS